MRSNISKLALTAALTLALTFAFSCSSDDSGNNGGGTSSPSSGVEGSYSSSNNNQVIADLVITTAEQLIDFATRVNGGEYFANKTVILGTNIMLNDTANWQNWADNPPKYTWTSIGTSPNVEECFKGTFDGRGYVISGVYANHSSLYKGLFNRLGVGGTIKNLGVTASYIKSEYGEMVGGLVGDNHFGTISNTYFIGVVKGEKYVGGLVGYNNGNDYAGVISNSYSIGVVEGDYAVGGLVGNNAGGSIKNSYYDNEKSGQSDTGKGIGKTTMEMKQKSTFVGWDFNEIWGINSRINSGYPYLQGGSYEIDDSSSSSSSDDDYTLLSSSSSVSSSVPSSSSEPTQTEVIPGNPVTYEGETYETVVIGAQTWMARNLNYAVEGSKCGGELKEDTSNCATYGRLYDWSTAMALDASCNSSTCASQVSSKHRGICPSGWHIPSNDEWNELIDLAGGYNEAGKYLKSKSGWNDYGGEDKYGFSALPGGRGFPDGFFDGVGGLGQWWSASEGNAGLAYTLSMYYSGEYVIYIDYGKSILYSVRCIKDN